MKKLMLLFALTLVFAAMPAFANLPEPDTPIAAIAETAEEADFAIASYDLAGAEALESTAPLGADCTSGASVYLYGYDGGDVYLHPEVGW